MESKKKRTQIAYTEWKRRKVVLRFGSEWWCFWNFVQHFFPHFTQFVCTLYSMHYRLISVTSHNKFPRSHETIQFPPLTERTHMWCALRSLRAGTTLQNASNSANFIPACTHTRFMYILHIVTCWTDSKKKNGSISILDVATFFPPSCLLRSVLYSGRFAWFPWAVYFIFDAHHQISAVCTCFKFDYTWFIALLPCEWRKKTRITNFISGHFYYFSSFGHFRAVYPCKCTNLYEGM